MATSKASGWRWVKDRHDVTESWEAVRGPIRLEAWEGGDEDRAWLWAVDIGGTGPSAPAESLALYGPPARTLEIAKRRAEDRATKFVLSLVPLVKGLKKKPAVRRAVKK